MQTKLEQLETLFVDLSPLWTRHILSASLLVTHNNDK